MNTASKSNDTLHFIVPCMGRLDFVKQTIEAAISQPNTTYTFVDYSCPQKSGEWVAEHYPQAKIIFAGSRPEWNPSEARNLGLKSIQDGWICILDSDVVLHPDFSATALAMARRGVFLRAPLDETHLFGLLVCAKEDFDRSGGYDEIMRGYGWEDIDFRVALERCGMAGREIPPRFMRHIDHDDTLRMKWSAIKDKFLNSAINQMYATMKNILVGLGEPCDEPIRRGLHKFAKERFELGYPWLMWPQADNLGAVLPGVYQTITSIGRDSRGVSAEVWGGVHAFRIERGGKPPMLELLTHYNRQTVAIRAPGKSKIAAMTLRGEKFSVPVENGIARLALTGESLFLLDDVELVKDVQMALSPAAGPSLNLDLLSMDGESRAVDVHIGIGAAPPVRHAVTVDSSAPVRLSIPVEPAGLGLPKTVKAVVTHEGVDQEITQQFTFLAASRVTPEEACELTPPARAAGFSLGGPKYRPGIIPGGVRGVEAPAADIAWGWTETDLICWVTRHADAMRDGSAEGGGVQIAVQPDNIRASFAPSFQFTLCWKGAENWVLLDRGILDAPITLPDILSGEESAACRRMVVRMPFETMGMTPVSGKSAAVSIVFSDDDGAGRKGRLEWGGGFGVVRDPRQFLEVTLGE